MPTLFEPPESHPISQLFDLTTPFVVDPYQRAYAWTFRPNPDETDEGEVADFIYDMKRVVDDASKDPDIPHYFFGLVVVAKQDNPGWHPKLKHEIVDGQQRLSTFALLASAMNNVAESIRFDALRSGDTATAARCGSFIDYMTGLYVEEKLTSTTGGNPELFSSLTLTANDDDYFQKLVRNKPPSTRLGASNDRLQAAKDALEVAVEDWVGSGTPMNRERALTEIRNTVFDKTEVILITANSTVDAYRLFAVANNRGKPLEQADLIRAYLLRLVSTSSDSSIPIDVVAAWNELGVWTPEQVNAALRAYYGSVVGERAPKIDVYDAFARGIFKHSEYDQLDDAEAEVVRVRTIDIRDAAKLYDKLAVGDWPYVRIKGKRHATKWEKHLLKSVVVGLGSTRAIPLLLAAAFEWAEEERFIDLMGFVEKAEFRFLTAGAHQSTVADRYFEAALLVRDGKGPQELINFLEPWVALLADDDAFRIGLMALSYKRRRRRVRHLLMMLDDHLAVYERFKRTGTWDGTLRKVRDWDISTVDIDHVYPQSATSDEKLNEIKQRLGNLTLLLDSANRNLAKKLLPTDQNKIDIYKGSEVKLTERLGRQIEQSGWTSKAAEKRHSDLADMAEFVYELSQASKDAAAKLETKASRRAARSQARATPLVWWLTHGKTSSVYKNIPGFLYHFGESLRAGKQVQAGDFVIEYRRTYGPAGRRRMWADDLTIGIGRVGTVDRLLGSPKKSNLQAVFSKYQGFDPPVRVGDLTSDSRDRSRNSIKNGTDAEFDELIAKAGLSSRDDLPDVPPQPLATHGSLTAAEEDEDQATIATWRGSPAQQRVSAHREDAGGV